MILVAGATGMVGREVMRCVATASVPVRAMTRTPDQQHDTQYGGSQVQWVFGDFRDPESLRAALLGVDRALLLSPADPQQHELQTNFIEAARSTGVKHIVKISALGADAHPPFESGRLHAKTEAKLAAAGIAFTVLRPHLFMQTLLRRADVVRIAGVLHTPGTDAAISIVDVRDVAAVAAAVLLTGMHVGEYHEITGPRSLTFGQMADSLSAATGRQVRHVTTPRADVRTTMLQRGLPAWSVDNVLDLHEAFASGGWDRTSTATREITGRAGRDFDGFAKEYRLMFGGGQAQRSAGA